MERQWPFCAKYFGLRENKKGCFPQHLIAYLWKEFLHQEKGRHLSPFQSEMIHRPVVLKLPHYEN